MKFLIVFPLLCVIFLVPRQDTTTCVTALLHLHQHQHQLGGSSSSSKMKATTTTTTRQSNRILRHGAAAESLSSSSFLSKVDEKQSSLSLSSQFCWKSSFLSTCCCCCLAGTLFLGGGGVALLQPLPVHANDDDLSAATEVTTVNIGRDSIAPCSKLMASDQNGAKKNCVSTASVKQLDLYAAPWTFNGSLTNPQVLEYLQQALREADRLVEIVQVNDDDGALRAQTTRALAKDQIDFFVNRQDRVIQFTSRQVQGPDVSDFGGNRQRLEEVRKKSPFGIMGVDLNAAGDEDVQKREGALGQLKAFYGLQSGAGFEGVLLNKDED